MIAQLPVTPIAVLDSSVLVPTWSRLVLQRLAAPPYQRYQPIWSEWILAETWRVLTIRAMQQGRSPSQIASDANAMLHYLQPVLQTISVMQVETTSFVASAPSRDRNDLLVWATAVMGRAHYVVSHNTRHFPPIVRERQLIGDQEFLIQRHLHEGIEFLTAIEFVEAVLGESVTAVLRRPLPQTGVVRSERLIRPA